MLRDSLSVAGCVRVHHRSLGDGAVRRPAAPYAAAPYAAALTQRARARPLARQLLAQAEDCRDDARPDGGARGEPVGDRARGRHRCARAAGT
eukprot:1274295-Prymnesium_polylepis.2